MTAPDMDKAKLDRLEHLYDAAPIKRFNDAMVNAFPKLAAAARALPAERRAREEAESRAKVNAAAASLLPAEAERAARAEAKLRAAEARVTALEQRVKALEEALADMTGARDVWKAEDDKHRAELRELRCAVKAQQENDTP